MAGRLTKWLLNGGYLLALMAISPVVVWRAVRHGRYRRGISEKFLGTVPDLALPEQPANPVQHRRTAWFHAVSVGEVVQLQKIVAEFRQQTSNTFQIVVTTSTDTGYDLAIRRFPDCCVTWFPLDFSWSVRRALHRIQPDLLVLMELEIWPNLIHACHDHDVPVAIVNARMSDRSVRAYQRIRRAIAPTLNRISLLAAQSSVYADRLIALGARAPCVHVTGSVKFDGVSTDRQNSQTLALRQILGIQPNELVWIVGSTQEPEEDICLQAWMQLQHEFPQLRLLIVPRHKERFEEVAGLITRYGLPLLRRSRISANADVTCSSPPHSDVRPPVILLDTIGELSACWGLADAAFVGGSFGNRGGQNMIEPAAYGAVVMFGPNTSNFRDVVSLFKAHDACIQLQHPCELLPALRTILQREVLKHASRATADDTHPCDFSENQFRSEDDSARYSSSALLTSDCGRRAQQVVLTHQGATSRTASLLVELVQHAASRSRKAG